MQEENTIDYGNLKIAHKVFRSLAAALEDLHANAIHRRLLVRDGKVPLDWNAALREFGKLNRDDAVITAELVEEYFGQLFPQMVLTINSNKMDISDHLLSLSGKSISDIDGLKYAISFPADSKNAAT